MAVVLAYKAPYVLEEWCEGVGILAGGTTNMVILRNGIIWVPKNGERIEKYRKKVKEEYEIIKRKIKIDQQVYIEKE